MDKKKGKIQFVLKAIRSWGTVCQCAKIDKNDICLHTKVEIFYRKYIPDMKIIKNILCEVLPLPKRIFAPPSWQIMSTTLRRIFPLHCEKFIHSFFPHLPTN